jgi:nitrite reductase/ring-hydroxylating ferredoxin subunit/uncharacterized membrane protein
MNQLDVYVDAVEKAEALDQVSTTVKPIFEKALPAGEVRNFFTGTWLGHPLHPLLTDVPIGAWTSATVLDLLGGKSGRKAADRLIGLGVLAAIPTAAAGAADWIDTGGGTQRIGVAHAGGNVAAITLFALSFTARKRGHRVRGVMLSLAAMGVATASAYLGGHLAFRKGVAVDTTAWEQPPEKWTPALSATELSDGKPVKGNAEGVDVFLLKQGRKIYGLSNTCTHRACGLHEGDVDDDTVTCPCHGSTFRLEDGAVVTGPAIAPARAFDVRVKSGTVEVRARK